MRLATNDDTVAPTDPFSEIQFVPLPRDAALGARLVQLAKKATDAGCDWMFHVSPDEQPSRLAIPRAALAMTRYDIIFGALETGSPPALWRPSRLAFDEADRLPHALLHWWVGHTFFARTDAVLKLAEIGALDAADDTESVFQLWQDTQSIKLAQALSFSANEPPLLNETARQDMLARLSQNPARMAVPYGERTYTLPYSGRNAGIERDQTRGMFFEQDELAYLAARIGPGRVIADIGANTGNHTVFFAGPMQAARVIPFEPLPDAATLVTLAVEWNGLANVDLTRIGHGVGAGRSRMRAIRGDRGGLGATRLVADAKGDIAVLPLDELLTEPVDFLKIDVETMEMDVLAGATHTITRDRPLIFIEIAEASTEDFRQWLGANDYVVERVFSDKGHTNLLVAPTSG